MAASPHPNPITYCIHLTSKWRGNERVRIRGFHFPLHWEYFQRISNNYTGHDQADPEGGIKRVISLELLRMK